MPVFSGKFSKSFLIASRPPAEAPTAAIGKAFGWLLRFSFFFAFWALIVFWQKQTFEQFL
jgi:hypothetical protein